jgi:hypothetical protein
METFGSWTATHITGLYEANGAYYLTNTYDNTFGSQNMTRRGMGFAQSITNTVFITNISVYIGGNGNATNCYVRVTVTNTLPPSLDTSDSHCVFATITNVPAYAYATHFTFSPGRILVPSGCYCIVSIYSTNTSDSDELVTSIGGTTFVNNNYLMDNSGSTLRSIGYGYSYPVLQGYGTISYTLDQFLTKVTNSFLPTNWFAATNAQVKNDIYYAYNHGRSDLLDTNDALKVQIADTLKISTNFAYTTVYSAATNFAFTNSSAIIAANTNSASSTNFDFITTTNGIASYANHLQSLITANFTTNYNSLALFYWTNGTGKNGTLFLGGGELQQIVLNGTRICTNDMGYPIHALMTIPLQPNDWVGYEDSTHDIYTMPKAYFTPF